MYDSIKNNYVYYKIYKISIRLQSLWIDLSSRSGNCLIRTGVDPLKYSLCVCSMHLALHFLEKCGYGGVVPLDVDYASLFRSRILGRG